MKRQIYKALNLLRALYLVYARDKRIPPNTSSLSYVAVVQVLHIGKSRGPCSPRRSNLFSRVTQNELGARLKVYAQINWKCSQALIKTGLFKTDLQC